MQSKPSPALVVSIIALVVALSGTAVAAKFLITRSGQIKNGVVTKSKLSTGVQSLLGSGGASPGTSDTQAIEAHRLNGPELATGGSSKVLELSFGAGTYAIFAKATITPVKDEGLLGTLGDPNRTVSGECTLDVNGTGDFAIHGLGSASTAAPATYNLQLTRTIDVPGKATLTCKADDVHWNGGNASIIAIKVGTSTRTEASRR